jgi:enoyl-CoA hydratase/carnithine racemase
MSDLLSASYPTLELERLDSSILVVHMNRPAAANAMNTQMGLDLMAVFEELQIRQYGLRCVALTGAGERAFCAGGDLVERRTMSD